MPTKGCKNESRYLDNSSRIELQPGMIGCLEDSNPGVWIFGSIYNKGTLRYLFNKKPNVI